MRDKRASAPLRLPGQDLSGVKCDNMKRWEGTTTIKKNMQRKKPD